jgi:large subunit ribosomal protein L31
MQQSPHPEHRTVVFRDQSAGVRFLTRSAHPTEHSTTWTDGRTYPVIEVDVSSAASRRTHRQDEAVSAGPR